MTTFRTIGKSEPRRDLPEKLTGEAKYAADVQLPGMLYGKILRSPHPHARILSIDVEAALSLPGVHAVMTPFDSPKGQVAPDMPILDTETRYVGDEVAAVAADDEDLAEAALDLIKVEYETLPFVTDAVEAIKPDAPHTRPGGNLVGGKPLTLVRGNPDEGFAEADRIFEDTYSTPAHHGAALEPRAAVASWDGDNLTVWKSTRGVHADQLALSLALDVPRGNIRVMGQNMGAGYGTKDETRLGVITAVLAQRAGHPVKIELTRQEEFVAGRHRHGTTTTVRMGVKNDGTVTAVHATTIMDTGAYLSAGPGVIRRAGQGALYLYKCANVQYDGYLAYTNTPAGGSYRALGAPQGHFALESLADTVSEALGIDPLEFRRKNHVGLEGQPGERVTPTHEILDTQPVEGGVPFSSNGLRECLEIGSEAIAWGQPSEQPEASNLRRGKGMGMFIYRGGAGGKSIARMRLESDGTLRLITGLMDVGEGSLTVMPQIAAEELGVDYEQVQVTFGDSATTPEAPITAGSTATFSTGTATQEAARQLKERIIEVAAPLLDADPSDLQITSEGVAHVRYPERGVTFSKIAESAGEFEVEASIMPGSRDHVINSFGAHFAEVEVDTDTGQVRVLKYVAAHDSGRILNPKLAINQVEGAVSQMLGFTMTEQMLTDPRNGVTLNASFLDHKSPTLQDFPDMQVLFADVVDPIGPYGAKALGEPPSIGVAPAVANAIYNAIGVRIRDLPMTPDRVLNEIEAQRGDSQ
ncbi:MAG: xanthine dehydrogenase family protein molybdopterin-binding subunit [SAR202 cluster bacterium]|jgi:xanthine dehydrogenase molybdenum-binding subunit|nr:xanthine dehydrogenase family protein molybdopterin-binding subunit [SAR202 cluster bacterium]